jgi:hypothetical protein
MMLERVTEYLTAIEDPRVWIGASMFLLKSVRETEP